MHNNFIFLFSLALFSVMSLCAAETSKQAFSTSIPCEKICSVYVQNAQFFTKNTDISDFKKEELVSLHNELYKRKISGRGIETIESDNLSLNFSKKFSSTVSFFAGKENIDIHGKEIELIQTVLSANSIQIGTASTMRIRSVFAETKNPFVFYNSGKSFYSTVIVYPQEKESSFSLCFEGDINTLFNFSEGEPFSVFGAKRIDIHKR